MRAVYMEGAPGSLSVIRSAMRDTAQVPVAVWGVGGVLVILLSSTWRLAGRSAGLENFELGTVHYVFEALWIAFMLYTEAWRGFHKQFSPRVVQRALDLPRRPLLILGAPLVCMGLFYATTKRLIISRGLIVGIVALVLLVRQLPEPWRELVDLGVTIGLGVGTLSLFWRAGWAAMGHEPGVARDFPGE